VRSGSRFKRADVVVIGAGHNGLVAAILLARHGLKVLVVEQKEVAGGAVRTEYPFAAVPRLGSSTGAYLLGVMPPELIKLLGINVPLIRRDPHYFLPTRDKKYVLFGSDQAATKSQFISSFSEHDWTSHLALQKELDEIRSDVHPALLESPLNIEETAERYLRKSLQKIFIDLCRGSVGSYLDRFGFKSDLVKAMYAATGGFTGCYGTWDTPGTGMNLLIHNLCRLPGSDGTWMIVKGGMGTVTRLLIQAAIKAGVQILTECPVVSIEHSNGEVDGVIFEDGGDGSVVRAKVVICNADPFRMRALLGEDPIDADYDRLLDNYAQLTGTSMKVNLAFKQLPKFNCLPDDQGQFRGTIHLLPEEKNVMAATNKSFQQAQNGELPDQPIIDWYFHTTTDPSLQDDQGHHSSALFVQWVPYQIRGSSWEKEESKFVRRLLSVCDEFAPGTSDLVVDSFALSPEGIERHFGMTHGQIFHIDHRWGFADRLPYETPIEGLYAASAACHPGGGVFGCAGHNAAMLILENLGIRKNLPDASAT
jgi:phytoene dehydrogenase-like protein